MRFQHHYLVCRVGEGLHTAQKTHWQAMPSVFFLFGSNVAQLQLVDQNPVDTTQLPCVFRDSPSGSYQLDELLVGWLVGRTTEEKKKYPFASRTTKKIRVKLLSC